MTKEQLAEILGGRQYGKEITDSEETQAKEHGLVVVFGASDDLMEFRGAIDDVAGCYDGGEAYINKGGLFYKPDNCDCSNIEDCPLLEAEMKKYTAIEAVWCPPSGASWGYETDIPHATFSIYEDDELYCVGIVFDIKSLD